MKITCDLIASCIERSLSNFIFYILFELEIPSSKCAKDAFGPIYAVLFLDMANL
jgi:hypothetical protein